MTLLGVFASTPMAFWWSNPPVVHVVYDEGTLHVDACRVTWHASSGGAALTPKHDSDYWEEVG